MYFSHGCSTSSVRICFAVAAQCAATSRLDQSTSDLSPDQTAFSSLLDRPSPLLPTSVIHTPREHDRRTLFRLDSPPPCEYGLRASLDRERCPRSSQSLRAD